MELPANNKLYVAVNYGERLFVKAKNERHAKEQLKRRLMRDFGKYNITDIKEIKSA